MVDLDWKNKMISSDIPNKSPRLSNKLQITIPPPKLRVPELSAASESSCASYDHFIRLQELKKLWDSNEFPGWKSESVLKPAFSGLEITFRLISTVLSDPRPYLNRKEWRRRLASLAGTQIEIIALICEEDEEDPETRGTIPIVDLTTDGGVLARENSSAEVWKMADVDTVVVCQLSEESLLPRLATWQNFEEVTKTIQYSIECHMQGCPYTLGLGEPNLSGKPSVDYDLICKPGKLHAIKKCPVDEDVLKNGESHILYTTHQMLESWIRVGKHLIERIGDEMDGKRYEKAANHCWVFEKVWSVLRQIEDLHLLMDPDDFLRLKNQLGIRALAESELFCFRSRELVEITSNSKNLKHKVPGVLEVEVDPTGGPRIQDAAMELYANRKEEEFAKIHLLQAMQAVEGAVKRFYFGYKQVLSVVMGSLEAKGNVEGEGLLSQIFLEPTYFPSLDAAKTFLGERHSPERRRWEGKK